MCSVCAMSAAAGAAGARAGLQAMRYRWLTPRRMKALTMLLIVGALGVSSVSLSGSSAPPQGQTAQQRVQAR
jgi:hypothetical protein